MVPYVEEKISEMCSHSLLEEGPEKVDALFHFHFPPRDPLGSYRNINTAMRLHTACRVGRRTSNTKLLERCRRAFLEFLESNLYADGSTFDFRDHDSLLHHLECLLLSLDSCRLLSLGLGLDGSDLHLHRNLHGACLVDAVFFVVPFMNGKKTNYLFQFSTHRTDHEIYRCSPWTPVQSVYFFHYLQREYPELYEGVNARVTNISLNALLLCCPIVDSHA